MATKIVSIKFVKEKTELSFDESAQPRDSQVVIEDRYKGKLSNLPRHSDFDRAMDRIKPHLVLASGLIEPLDALGSLLTAVDFNDYFADADEAPMAYHGLELTQIRLKDDAVQLIGTKATDFGEDIPLKTPFIPLVRSQAGYNYPLLEVLDNQIDLLLSEAEKYRTRKKHGAGVQLDLKVA